MPKKADVDNFGTLLRQIRKSKKITLKAMSKRTGYSPSYLSNLETGHLPPHVKDEYSISDGLIEKLARALDTPIKTFHVALGRPLDEPSEIGPDTRGNTPSIRSAYLQNLNTTPEQDRELLALQREFEAQNVKDAIFKAARLALVLRREVKNGRRISLKDRAGNITEVIVPEWEKDIAPRWTYLAERPESWKTQLYVRGRRLTAANVWLDMLANKMTPEETADNWDLPIEAINEIIEYCRENGELIKNEADEEKRSLLSHGVKLSA